MLKGKDNIFMLYVKSYENGNKVARLIKTINNVPPYGCNFIKCILPCVPSNMLCNRPFDVMSFLLLFFFFLNLVTGIPPNLKEWWR